MAAQSAPVGRRRRCSAEAGPSFQLPSFRTLHREWRVPDPRGWVKDEEAAVLPHSLFFRDWRQAEPLVGGALELGPWGAAVRDSDLVALAASGARPRGLDLAGAARLTDRGAAALGELATNTARQLKEQDRARRRAAHRAAQKRAQKTAAAGRRSGGGGGGGGGGRGGPGRGGSAAADASYTSGLSFEQSEFASTYSSLPGDFASLEERSRAGSDNDESRPNTTASTGRRKPPPPAAAAEEPLPADHVRHLSLRGCELIGDRGIQALRPMLPALATLDLGELPRVTSDGLRALLSACDGLRRLALAAAPGLDDRAVAALAKRVRDTRCLLRLDLRRCLRFSDEGLLALLHRTGFLLQGLNLAGCAQLSAVGLFGLTRCPALRSLDLSDLPRAEDPVLGWVARHCAGNLQELRLARCAGLTDGGLQYLRAGLPLLDTLDLARNPGLTDAGLAPLLAGCPALTHLDCRQLVRLTDRTLGALALRCPLLRVLRLAGCRGAGDPGLRALGGEGGSALQAAAREGHTDEDEADRAAREARGGCPLLEELDLTYSALGLQTDAKSRITQVTSAGVAALAGGCPGLRALRLNGASKLTDPGVAAVARRCPGLETLLLRSCHHVTNTSIVALAEGCPKLRELDLAACPNVTDSAVVAVAEGCPELVHIDLIGLDKLTNKSLMALGANCPLLENIDLQGCDMIDSEGVAALAAGCPRLRRLSLRGLDEVGDRAAEALARHSWALTEADFTQTALSEEALAALARRLPLAVPSAADRARLAPAPPGCRRAHAHALDLLRHHRHAVRAQAQVRRLLARRAAHRKKTEVTAAALAAQRLARGFLARRRRRRLALQRLRRRAAARRLQRFCRLVRATLARYRAAQARARAQASALALAVILQRRWRGRRGRARAAARRAQRARVWTAWGRVAGAAMSRERAREHWRATRAIQTLYRAWRARRRCRGELRRVVRAQAAARRWLARRAVRRALELKFEGALAAAVGIQRRFRRYRQWCRVLALIQAEREALEARRARRLAAARTLQGWWRARMQARVAKAFADGLRRQRQAATAIQMAWRCHYARYVARRLGARRAKVVRRWGRWAAAQLRRWRRAAALRVQRPARAWLARRRALREWAGTEIQRVWRGHRGRRAVAAKRDLLARAAERARRRASREFRAKQKQSVLKIEKAYRAMRARRMMKNAAKQLKNIARNQQILEKQVLVEQQAISVLQRHQRQAEDAAARAIQKWYSAKMAQRRAREVSFMAKERRLRDEYEEALRARRLERRKARQDRSAGAALARGVLRAGRGLGALLSAAPADPGRYRGPPLKERLKRRREVLIHGEARPDPEVVQTALHAVVKHQINQVHQSGIIDLVIKVGEAEDRAMRDKQHFNELNDLPVYKKIKQDLSGNDQRKVFLWYLNGEGKREVITKICLQLCPDKGNIDARKLEMEGVHRHLITHPDLEMEIIAFKELGLRDAVPLVERLAVSADKHAAAALQRRGFEMVKPALLKFRLGEAAALWVYHRAKTEKPAMIDKAARYFKGEEWFSWDVREVMARYALGPESVRELRKLFVPLAVEDGGEATDLNTFADAIREERGRYHDWFLEMIQAQSRYKMTFVEFLKIVCFYCMFSAEEMNRYVFGMMDKDRRGYIDKDQFEVLSEILLEKEKMPINKHMLDSCWEKYCIQTRGNPKFDKAKGIGASRMYYDQYKKIVKAVPVLTYAPLRNQTNMQERFLGKAFWNNQKTLFAQARTDLGMNLKSAV